MKEYAQKSETMGNDKPLTEKQMIQLLGRMQEERKIKNKISFYALFGVTLISIGFIEIILIGLKASSLISYGLNLLPRDLLIQTVIILFAMFTLVAIYVSYKIIIMGTQSCDYAKELNRKLNQKK